ncbi:hypothetical protein V6N13_071894 [Hibiscus sabdariffa]
MLPFSTLPLRHHHHVSALCLVGDNEMVDQNLLLLFLSLFVLRKSFKKTHLFELLPTEDDLEEEADIEAPISLHISIKGAKTWGLSKWVDSFTGRIFLFKKSSLAKVMDPVGPDPEDPNLPKKSNSKAKGTELSREAGGRVDDTIEATEMIAKCIGLAGAL